MNYKVLFVPSLDDQDQFEKEYEAQKEAEIALDVIANYTTMLHESGFMQDHANFGMVMMKDEDGDWVEIDGDGEEI